MPTSDWPAQWRRMGNHMSSLQLRHRRRDSGVTLVEILVVLALIGVSAGVVTYALPSGAPERTVEQEADLLAARVNIAAERSLIQGRHHTVVWDTQSYQFKQWEDGEWQVAKDAPLSEQHMLDGEVLLSNADGAQRGVLHIGPALLPSGGEVQVLRLTVESVMREISFDGASARVAPARP